MPAKNSGTNSGAIVMVVGALIFIAYAVVFFYRSFSGQGFEIGVADLNGVTPADLDKLNPAVMGYISHLHIATAAFIAATGIAVSALAWYGVRRGEWWAWLAAVVSPVVGLVVALPMHYMGVFSHNWVTHLGPIYLGTLVFVLGALLALNGLIKKA